MDHPMVNGLSRPNNLLLFYDGIPYNYFTMVKPNHDNIEGVMHDYYLCIRANQSNMCVCVCKVTKIQRREVELVFKTRLKFLVNDENILGDYSEELPSLRTIF